MAYSAPMKAVTYSRYGPPDRLNVEEVPVPVPKDNQVLVRVHAASLNSWDWDLLRGGALVRPESPFRPKYRILGADVAGVVTETGSAVTRFKPGDAVFGDLSEGGWGTLAEFVAADEAMLARKPDGLDFTGAAAIPQAGSLAFQGIRGKRPARPGDRVLVNGAGGGVGSFAVQIAKLDGAEVTAVDRGDKRDFMRELGAHKVLDYRATDYTRTGDRYDLILDMIDGKSMFAYRNALRPGGHFVMVGGTWRGILRCFTVGGAISAAGDRKLGMLFWRPRVSDYEDLATLVAAGQIRPAIHATFPLAEAAEAFRLIASGDIRGKVVIRIEGTESAG